MLVLHKMLDQAALNTMQQQSECHHSLQHWKSQKQTSTFGKQLPSRAVYSCGPYLLLPLFTKQSLQKHGDKILETILPTCLNVCFICTVHISTHMFFYLYLIRIQAHFHSSQASRFLSGLYCQIKFKLALWNWKTERTKCALNCFNIRIQLDTHSTGTYQVFTEKLVAPPPSQNLTSVLRKCLHVC
jgi:hypothetical protein